METLSFSMRVKEESARVERTDEEKRAFLSSFIHQSSYISLSDKKDILDIYSEQAIIVKTIYLYIDSLYGLKGKFSYTRSSAFKKRLVFHLLIDNARDLLSDLDIDFFSGNLPESLIKTPEQKASYMVGLFLANGSVNSPGSKSYHLEIKVGNEAYAKKVMKLWNKGLPVLFSSKIVSRRGHEIIYLKRSGEISDFLILLGAKQCCLEFENVRTDRDFVNIDNRFTNLDMANLSKTIKASEKQQEAIKFLKESGEIYNITNPKLSVLINIREKYPDASLNELAALLSKEMNTEITKSNINHLFRSLLKLYEEKK